MANIIECDGCGDRISSSMPRGDELPAVRALGMSGQADGRDFHWCVLCAGIAVAAVRAAAGRGVLSDEDRIREAMAEAQEHPGRMVTR